MDTPTSKPQHASPSSSRQQPDQDSASRSQPDPARKVNRLYPALHADIGDLITYRAFPTTSCRMGALDPFIFLNHHGPQTYSPGNDGLPFGPHPHRGFETVTFILEGSLLHKDSGGYESVIETGGIQWMTAGSGLIHAELSPEEFKRTGGKVEVLQLWVNLPSRLKMTKPNYVGLQHRDIPRIEVDDGKVEVNLVSGSFGGKTGPVKSLTDVSLSWIRLKFGGKVTLPVPVDETLLCYVVSGRARVNGVEMAYRNTADFGVAYASDSNAGTGAGGTDSVVIEATEETLVLFGHARPNDEPIASYGPFVMNTQDEIVQAVEDYRAGKFGIWTGDEE